MQFNGCLQGNKTTFITTSVLLLFACKLCSFGKTPPGWRLNSYMDGSTLARGHWLFMSWLKYCHVLSKMNCGQSEPIWLRQQVGNGFLDQKEKVEQGRSDHGGHPMAPSMGFFSHHTHQDWQGGRLGGIKGSPDPSIPLSVIPFPFRPLLPSSGGNWM